MPKLDRLSVLKSKSPKQRFVYWINEREKIRQKKELLKPKPWTVDPILSEYKFCNVVRMDDRVSQWLKDNWFDPFYDHPNMIPAVAIARHFNRPETLEPITNLVFADKLKPQKILSVIKDLQKKQKIFNAAYIITGKGADGLDKASCVMLRTLSPFLKCVVDNTSMQKTHSVYCSYWNIGSFMAGQIVSDLRQSVNGSWEDSKTWAPIGPGSRRGMNRIHGRPIESKISQLQFEKELSDLIKYAAPKIPKQLSKRMEAMDWQNCLCETDKFNRSINGEGRPKQRYSGSK